MKLLLLLVFAILVLPACDTEHRPSYEELKAENDDLQGQLANIREKIEEAKSELDALKDEIRNVEDEPCHEDSTGDLGSKADDIDSTLDQAEEDSN